MNLLQELISKTKASLALEVNLHKDEYATVEEYLRDYNHERYINDIPQDIYNKMIELDTVIELTVYPRTPVGFYKLYHYDLEKVLTEALKEEL